MIISTDDTYLFYLTGKKNLIDANPAVLMVMKKELDRAVKNVSRVCPTSIAVDCSIIKKCEPYQSFNQGERTVLPFILREVEAACRFKYEPTICTNQLCIAKPQKK